MSIQEKYALTDEGLKNVKLGAVWTAATNLVVFGGVGALYLLMSELVAHLTEGAPLPNLAPYAAGLAAFIVALFVAEYWPTTTSMASSTRRAAGSASASPSGCASCP